MWLGVTSFLESILSNIIARETSMLLEWNTYFITKNTRLDDDSKIHIEMISFYNVPIYNFIYIKCNYNEYRMDIFWILLRSTIYTYMLIRKTKWNVKWNNELSIWLEKYWKYVPNEITIKIILNVYQGWRLNFDMKLWKIIGVFLIEEKMRN